MKRIACAWLIFAAGCSSSPTAPTTANQPVTPVSAPTLAPPVVTTTVDPFVPVDGFDLGFYRDFALGQFAYGRLFPLARLNAAPMIFLNTVDRAGQPIDAVTLDTVSAAFIAVASTWSGGRFGLAGIQRGVGTREGVPGWLTVTWDATRDSVCGDSNTGRDGGVIGFYTKNPNCGCNGSLIRPVVAKHELGHAFGYSHTRNTDDVMAVTPSTCDLNPSDRERLHATIAYGRPVGSLDPS